MTEQEIIDKCTIPARIDWKQISRQKDLPEDFIRKYADCVNWEQISARQTLSEDFIREFKDKF